MVLAMAVLTFFILDYLTFRKQRTKVGSAYSKWSKRRRGIPQGSILGQNLFNIFVNYIFIIIEQSVIFNFADDNTHGNNIDTLY